MACRPYNVEIEETEVSPGAKIARQLSESLYIINAFAQKFFTDNLLNQRKARTLH